MSHSPLPWSVHESGEIADADGVFVASAEGEVETPNDNGNREMIVAAVNNHAKLVRVIEAIMNDCDDCLNEESDMPTLELIDAIRGACVDAIQGLLLDTTPNQDVGQP